VLTTEQLLMIIVGQLCALCFLLGLRVGRG
jgi:hypothetical protein